MNVATIGTGFIVDWFLTAVQESANISCVAMFHVRNPQPACWQTNMKLIKSIRIWMIC